MQFDFLSILEASELLEYNVYMCISNFSNAVSVSHRRPTSSPCEDCMTEHDRL